MSTGRLQAQSQLINQAFDHDKAGRLVVALEKPYFKGTLDDLPF